MRIIYFVVCIFLGAPLAFAFEKKTFDDIKLDNPTPEELVMAQIDAYNTGDINSFLSTFAPDIKIYNFPDQLSTSGIEKMRTSFSHVFTTNPDLHAEVEIKGVKGSFVILHETITGLDYGDDFDVIAIYEVNQNNKIQNLWFVR
ncbi:nuclear transport factor 2 family protein [Shewanella sp. MBTL60-112-B1]|uniref:nuclear transport factor 2 family protein n=1 Tax=Shewanella sp. MBTL60-112-B1 TaxID=2815916 RepID=UPI001BBEB9B6|nr:nuclear transport factor 2 family protein [Shewanella sp. MBTL60-112-B1]GIU05851.1 hypothetical protein TUM4444_02860 [Shewanella sp. MBTL60-112-B1]